MRLERQPSLQLRESLNVCWERWRERERVREIERGDEIEGRSQVGGGSQELARLWKVKLKKGRKENEGRWVNVHKTAGSEENR